MRCLSSLMTGFVEAVAVVTDFSEKTQRRGVQPNQGGYAQDRQLVGVIVVAFMTHQLRFVLIFNFLTEILQF